MGRAAPEMAESHAQCNLDLLWQWSTVAAAAGPAALHIRCVPYGFCSRLGWGTTSRTASPQDSAGDRNVETTHNTTCLGAWRGRSLSFAGTCLCGRIAQSTPASNNANMPITVAMWHNCNVSFLSAHIIGTYTSQVSALRLIGQVSGIPA